jgi:hypothetical protein
LVENGTMVHPHTRSDVGQKVNRGMDESAPGIRVDRAKLEQITAKLCLPDHERVLVVISADLALKKSEKGALALTRIGLYLFRAKAFGAVEFITRVNLLMIKSILVTAKKCTIELSAGSPIVFKSADAALIVTGIQTVIQEVTFRLRDAAPLAIRSDIPLPDVDVHQRPPLAFKWRLLLLCDFLRPTGTQSSRGAFPNPDYFQKWEDKQKPLLVIGPSFKPGAYFNACGQAIAWESTIDSVCFQSFMPPRFGQFLDTLLDHATTIDHIYFSDYKHPPKLEGPNQFGFVLKVHRTSVRNWSFIRCYPDLILGWVEASKGLPSAVDHVALVGDNFEPEQFRQLVDSIQRSPPASGMRKFELARSAIKQVPFADVTRLISFTADLETVIFRDMDMDAARLLVAICKANTRLRVLQLSQMKFSTEIDADCDLPSSVIHVNLSNNAMATVTIISLLRLMTKRPRAIPIIVDMSKLVHQMQLYQALQELPFDQCYPNIVELNWSNNHIAGDPKFFFAFLFTQKRLRLLSLKAIIADDPVLFMTYLMRFGVCLPLPGLDFSLSDTKTNAEFVQFVMALRAWPGLRRLNVAGSKSGGLGMGALNDVIQDVTTLNELRADGFAPKSPEAIAVLWTTIELHPGLRACDLPLEDMKKAGLTVSGLDQAFGDSFAALRGKPRLPSLEQRVEYTVKTARDNGQPDFTAEIFQGAAKFAGFAVQAEQAEDVGGGPEEY